MENQQPSAGKQVALAGLSATQAVTLLMFVCEKLGLTGVTPEIAAAIIGLAMALAGGIMHDLQRKRERRALERQESIKATEVGPA